MLTLLILAAACFLIGRVYERRAQATAQRRAKLEQMARARTQCDHREA